MKKNNKSDISLWDRFKRKSKSLLVLFWSMFKIGLFTFGGGYAMIHLLEHEFVAKRKWLDNEDFFDLVTIAESTPGPVAINCSTYIGYKTEKFIGSLVATTAMCIPSFVIIFVISLFFDAFLANTYVAAAFKGIQVCAVFLILCAGIKMAKKIKFNIFNLVIFIATLAAMILVSIFNAKFSSIYYILISGAIGLFIYSIGYFKNKTKQQMVGIDTKGAIEPPSELDLMLENCEKDCNSPIDSLNSDDTTNAKANDENIENTYSSVDDCDCCANKNNQIDEPQSTNNDKGDTL